MKDTLMNGLLSFAGKMQSNKLLSSIKNAFIDNMPCAICGSFCVLIQFVVCIHAEGYLSLANIPGMDWLQMFTPIFTAANYGTINMMAVSIVILVALHYGEQMGLVGDKTLIPVALGSFISLVNTTITAGTDAEGNAITATGLASTFTNAQGLFVALIVGLCAAALYSKMKLSGKLSIKLPDSVPPNVSASFEVLFPATLTILIVSAAGWLFKLITKMTLFDAITTYLQAPLKGAMTSIWGYLVIVLAMMLLWWFGIHGPNVMSAITSPVMTAAMAENLEKYSQGTKAYDLPNIICTPFGSTFFSSTGSGVTGGLIIAILLFSKRDDYKAIAKLAIPCGIFNINEPIIFGIPMVMNPLLGIPFILIPVLTVSLGYILTAIGICPRFAIDVPWTTPCGILAFLASGGNFVAALCQLVVMLGVSTLVYTPFVIISNSQE